MTRHIIWDKGEDMFKEFEVNPIIDFKNDLGIKDQMMHKVSLETDVHYHHAVGR
jgi:hypothetical protein